MFGAQQFFGQQGRPMPQQYQYGYPTGVYAYPAQAGGFDMSMMMNMIMMVMMLGIMMGMMKPIMESTK